MSKPKSYYREHCRRFWESNLNAEGKFTCDICGRVVRKKSVDAHMKTKIHNDAVMQSQEASRQAYIAEEEALANSPISIRRLHELKSKITDLQRNYTYDLDQQFDQFIDNIKRQKYYCQEFRTLHDELAQIN